MHRTSRVCMRFGLVSRHLPPLSTSRSLPRPLPGVGVRLVLTPHPFPPPHLTPPAAGSPTYSLEWASTWCQFSVVQCLLVSSWGPPVPSRLGLQLRALRSRLHGLPPRGWHGCTCAHVPTAGGCGRRSSQALTIESFDFFAAMKMARGKGGASRKVVDLKAKAV